MINPKLNIGLIGVGSGSDFIRSLGIPRNYRESLSVFKNYVIKKCDVGFAKFNDHQKKQQRRYFINIAGIGLAGLIPSKVHLLIPFMPPGLAYFLVVARYFLTFKKKKLTVTMDSNVKYEGNCFNLFIANLKYSGAGMCWAPEAKMDDGLLDVIIIDTLPKWRILAAPWKVYDGSLGELPGYHLFKTQQITIKSEEKVLLELDGEQCGMLPLTCTIIPQAINLIVPAGLHFYS